MRNLWTLLCLALVLGCAPRGDFVGLPEGSEPSATKSVFVASARPDTDRYSRIEVAIPAERNPGSVTYPQGAPDPDGHFLVAGRHPFETPESFRREVARALSALPRAQREIIIYVHGYNTTMAEGTFRIAQLSHDLNLPGVAVHFSWPSEASPLAYAHDRDMALWSRDALRLLVRDMGRLSSGRVILLAHSLGGHLVMETLRDMELQEPGRTVRLVDAVLLISPDIDVNVFRAQAAVVRELPEPFVIVTSTRDQALRLSARLTGQGRRLGNLADAGPLADLDVLLLDVSAFSSGVGHFTAGSSPALLGLLSQFRQVGEMLGDDVSGQAGVLPGTVLTVRNATQVILTPSAR